MKPHLPCLLFCFLVARAAFAQPGIRVTLAVEDSVAYTVYRNEPLVFTTTLVNEALQQSMEWNEAADAWLAEVAAEYKAGKRTREDYDRETALVTGGKKPLKVETIGTLQQPWFHRLQFRVLPGNGTDTAAWPVALLGDPLTDAVAVLDANGYYQVKHHLAPGEVAKRKPGTYTVQVMLEGVWSNAVTVRIRPDNIPAGVLQSPQMQLRLGNYYLEQKDADKALEQAAALLKRNPVDIAALVLRGEGHILNKDYSLALVAFEKALQQHRKRFPQLKEPPEYLKATIAWLKERE